MIDHSTVGQLGRTDEDKREERKMWEASVWYFKLCKFAFVLRRKALRKDGKGSEKKREEVRVGGLQGGKCVREGGQGGCLLFRRLCVRLCFCWSAASRLCQVFLE